MRNQDLSIAGVVLQNPYGTQQSWQFVKSHYDDYKKKASARGPQFIIAATGAFCDPALQKDADKFLTQHPERGAERIVKRAQESTAYCLELKQRETTPLQKWLSQHRETFSAPGQ